MPIDIDNKDINKIVNSMLNELIAYMELLHGQKFNEEKSNII